jgi:hypothetical protein
MSRRENSHLDSVLVLTVEHLHGLDSLGNGTSTTDQNTIDIEGVCISISDSRLFRCVRILERGDCFDLLSGQFHGSRNVVGFLVHEMGRDDDGGTTRKQICCGILA